MRPLVLPFLVAVVLVGAPAASAAALLEAAPGRALVAVGGDARLVAAPEVRARVGAVGEAWSRWAPADGIPLGPGGCEAGLCGLVRVEVRGGEAFVVEGRTGVLVPAPEEVVRAAASPDAAVPPSAPRPVPSPSPSLPLALALALALARR